MALVPPSSSELFLKYVSSVGWLGSVLSNCLLQAMNTVPATIATPANALYRFEYFILILLKIHVTLKTNLEPNLEGPCSGILPIVHPVCERGVLRPYLGVPPFIAGKCYQVLRRHIYPEAADSASCEGFQPAAGNVV